MTEREFTDQVIQYARLHGWRVAHFRPARTVRGWRTAVQGDGQGFPDLILCRDAELVAAELKVGAQVTPEQRLWLEAIEDAGAAAYVWRPGDWSEIEEVLG